MILSPLPFTASADPRREIPAGDGSRLDRIEAALETLAAEELRLKRLGLGAPMARCREQRLYWSFLRAIFTLSEAAPARSTPRGVFSWPGDRIR